MIRQLFRQLRGLFGSASVGKVLRSAANSATIVYESPIRSDFADGLLIRRSWVRDPPGSFHRDNDLASAADGQTPSASGNFSGKLSFDLARIDRDRELRALNLALRHGTKWVF